MWQVIGWISFQAASISDFPPSRQPTICFSQRMPTGKKVRSENISLLFIQKLKPQPCLQGETQLPVSPHRLWGCWLVHFKQLPLFKASLNPGGGGDQTTSRWSWNRGSSLVCEWTLVRFTYSMKEKTPTRGSKPKRGSDVAQQEPCNCSKNWCEDHITPGLYSIWSGLVLSNTLRRVNQDFGHRTTLWCHLSITQMESASSVRVWLQFPFAVSSSTNGRAENCLKRMS